jgi:hypothetical protein
LWIIKPAAGAQGRGIFIFKTLQDYLGWRKSIEPTITPANATITPTPTQSHNDPETSTAATLSPPDLPSSDQPQGNLADPITNNASAPTTTVTDPTVNPPAPTVPETRPEVIRQDAYVVQRYIENPYLIGGRKFDIRFYVLVTSYNPLVAWVYREGFSRFSAGQFSLDALQDVYIHLTNVAIQRTSEDYNPEKGSKWSLQSLREYLTARHGREKVQHMFNLIDVIVVRTLQSVCHCVLQDKHCFEVYGFDVLIDRNLVPWLLEVNASPAFTPSNEEDYILKCGLIDDTVSVLDLEGRLTGTEKRIGGYDLIWKNGPIYANPCDSGYAVGVDGGPKLNSFLGCRNDRVQQLRELYKACWFLKGACHVFRSGTSLAADTTGFWDENLTDLKLEPGNDERWKVPA